jgi:type II secretory pathway component GspD/PulD (secretin)
MVPSQLAIRTAIQLSPQLWLELSQDLGTVLNTSHQLLGAEDVQRVLRAVARDKNSRISSTSTVCTLCGKTAILTDALELLAPTGYRQEQSGRLSRLIPEFDEARDVGVILEMTPTVAADQRHITVELSPEYSQVASWLPIGPTRGIPQYLTSTVETQVVIPRGHYMLLGGGGKPGTDESPIIWLIGADSMGW